MNDADRREYARLDAIYRRYAPIYDWLFGRLYASARRRSIDGLALQRGARVAIPGVGTGLDLPAIPPMVEVVGLDVNEMLSVAARRPHSTAFSAVLADAQRLPFDDASFDATILHLILSVAPRPDAVFAEAVRITRPGGRIAVLDQFAPDAEELSRVRRALNPIARLTGTDITRRLPAIVSGQPVTISVEWKAVCGTYRGLQLLRSA